MAYGQNPTHTNASSSQNRDLIKCMHTYTQCDQAFFPFAPPPERLGARLQLLSGGFSGCVWI